MKNSLFDSEQLKDYTFYGILSGIFFSIFVWFFLFDANYTQTWIMYIGSAFFMFIIMLYVIKLSMYADNLRSSKNIVYAGHLTVVFGVMVSVLLSLVSGK